MTNAYRRQGHDDLHTGRSIFFLIAGTCQWSSMSMKAICSTNERSPTFAPCSSTFGVCMCVVNPFSLAYTHTHTHTHTHSLCHTVRFVPHLTYGSCLDYLGKKHSFLWFPIEQSANPRVKTFCKESLDLFSLSPLGVYVGWGGGGGGRRKQNLLNRLSSHKRKCIKITRSKT